MYGYTANDPVNFIDVLGLEEEPVWLPDGTLNPNYQEAALEEPLFSPVDIISFAKIGLSLVKAGFTICAITGKIILRDATQVLGNEVGSLGGKNIVNIVEKYLGKGAKVITNKNGDKVFISKDGTRKVRFDINNPSPHQSPHGHVEELINGKWVKSGPVYPQGVPKK